MYNLTQFADSSRSQLSSLRSAFHVVTIKANQEALDIVHDVFFDMMETQISGVTNVFVPVTEHFLSVSTANGGDPMGVDATPRGLTSWSKKLLYGQRSRTMPRSISFSPTSTPT